jgi:hypothetical protein
LGYANIHFLVNSNNKGFLSPHLVIKQDRILTSNKGRRSKKAGKTDRSRADTAHSRHLGDA